MEPVCREGSNAALEDLAVLVPLGGADRMINPETQDFMAQRMKATLRRLDVDHAPIATAHERVVELLLEAGKSVAAEPV